MAENDINLAALWVPVMAETSHVKSQLRQAGEEGRKEFQSGLGNLGDIFSQKITEGLSDTRIGSSLDKLSSMFDSKSALMAGVIGGAVSGGIMVAEKGFEEFFELAEKGFEATIEVAKELAHTILETGETFETMEFQLTEFTNKSSEGIEELGRSARNVFDQIDTTGEGLGKTMAQLSQRLELEAGPALEQLTKHVIELSDRTGKIDVERLTGAMSQFGVEAANADSVLASWNESARRAGESVAELLGPLSDGGEMFKAAGLNAQQAGAYVAELGEKSLPVSKIIAGLSTAQKVFSERGMDFKAGLAESIKELDELQKAGDTANLDALSQKLFGNRNWTQARAGAQALLDVLNQAPGAFDAAGSGIDQMTDSTESLSNKWEKVWHQIQDALHPLGTAAIDVIGAGFAKLDTYIKQHADQINAAIKHLGDNFIGFLPVLQRFVVESLAILSPLVKGFEMTFGAILQSFSLFTKGLAEPLKPIAELMEKLHIPGADKLVAVTKEMFGASDEMSKAAKTMFDTPMGSGIDKVQEWVKQQHIDVPKLQQDWEHLWDSVNKAPEGMPPGFTPWWGPGAAGGSAGGAGADLAQHLASPSAVPSGASGTTGALEPYIVSAGQQAGLTPTEIGMALAVEQHEGLGPTGNPSMGFGPEAKANGFNFDQNPRGAVDQFIRQYLTRLPANLDRNDPRAIADYIWHTVHNAADPNYGSGLMNSYKGPVSGAPSSVPTMTAPSSASIPMASGGSAADAFAQSVSGHAYSWGGFGDQAHGGLYDCSGFMSALYGILTGKSMPGDTRFFTTHSNFEDLGFVPTNVPVPGAFQIGVSEGHMAGTLPSGVNVESGGAANATQYGGSAAGAWDPQFQKHYYLPGSGGSGVFAAGGGTGMGRGRGGLTPDQLLERERSLRHAQEAVDDANADVSKDEGRVGDLTKELNDLKSKPGLLSDPQKIGQKEKELADATDALAKARRRQRDAAEDQQIAEFKASEPGKGGSGKGEYESMGQQLGSGLLKGLGQELGFGDIFKGKPPWEWGIFKLFTGLAGWGLGEANALGDAMGGMPGAMPMGGGPQIMGGGGGGLLGGLMKGLPGVGSMLKATGGLGPSPVAGVPSPAAAGLMSPSGYQQNVTNDNRIIVSGNTMSDPYQMAGPIKEINNAQTAQRTSTGGLPLTVGGGGG